MTISKSYTQLIKALEARALRGDLEAVQTLGVIVLLLEDALPTN